MRPTRARLLGEFGRLFAGRVWEHFGGALATNPTPGERAVVRQKRPLDAPPPDVHFFETDDGVELRLVRYNGGAQGTAHLRARIQQYEPGLRLGRHRDQLGRVLHAGTATTSGSWTTAPARICRPPERSSRSIRSRSTTGRARSTTCSERPAPIPCRRSAIAWVRRPASWRCSRGGCKTVRQFVASQVMPFVEVSNLAKLKAGVRLDRSFAELGVRGVDTDAGRTADRKSGRSNCCASARCRAEWQTLGPVCRRIYAIYGPVMNPAQINRDTRDALDWIFGYGNVTSFGQIRPVHPRTAGSSMPMAPMSTCRTSIACRRTSCCCRASENELFLPKGSAETSDGCASIMALTRARGSWFLTMRTWTASSAATLRGTCSPSCCASSTR